ncbi:homogentisate 1,2-dioxygenase [Streptomyces sp. Y7]|uniref:homogentisate 1,2-dioxygenase n=1 Tax=Streptomyces sp. Y7 TaxID=3342392 RepID=UPI00371064F3
MTISQETTTEAAVRERARKRAATLAYSTGFGNEHSSEALAGALPRRNTPQRPPYGLYTELLTGTAFTEPRQNTRRTLLYRIRPSVASPRFERTGHPTLLTPPFTAPVEPNLMYWDPRPAPAAGTDFLSGLWTLGGNGDPGERTGMALHLYTADTSMTDRVFRNADGELLIVPEQGGLLIHTELGLLAVEPGELVLIPRSIAFRAEILGAAKGNDEPGFVRGYVVENFGAPFSLPELGVVGTTGMANPRDFRTPAAAYDDSERPVEVVHKVAGNLWSATYDHSPLDVVAWHGNSVPYVFDMRDFQLMGSVNFDHPDPSRFTALTSTTATPGLNNIDFTILPPEWAVQEDTFRPAYFHRNISTEFVGVIETYAHVWPKGISALTQMLTPHGPGSDVWQAATNDDLKSPFRVEGLLVLIETLRPIYLTDQAVQAVGTTDDETLSGDNTLQSNFRY